MRSELIPLADRLRYSQLFRLVLAGALLLLRLGAPFALPMPLRSMSLVLGIYLVAIASAEIVWRQWGDRARYLFGALLLADGVVLAWVVQESGSVNSPVLFLTLVHVVVTTLVASYRTGLKLALWHSLLAYALVQAEEAGAIGDASPGSAAVLYPDLVVFVAALWILAIATASFSAVNERELRRRRYDLEALAAMTAELRRAVEPAAVLDVLLKHLVDVFGFVRGVALVGGPSQVQLLGRRRAGGEAVADAETVSGVPDPTVRHAWSTGDTLLLSRLAPEDTLLGRVLPDARNVMIVPLLAEDRPLGVIALECESRLGSRIEQRVVATVKQFVADGALALDNVGLLQRITLMAETDGLTGIANRRTFDSTLEAAIARSTRLNQPVSLVMIDIDHFKRLNDEHGHQMGDEVLRRVAASLAGQSRGTDTVARYGGEEFAVIVPGCPTTTAEAVAERFRLRVAGAETAVPVTASAGAAVFPDHAGDVAGLIRAADEALYASKLAGRDRLTMPGPQPPPVPERGPAVAAATTPER